MHNVHVSETLVVITYNASFDGLVGGWECPWHYDDYIGFVGYSHIPFIVKYDGGGVRGGDSSSLFRFVSEPRSIVVIKRETVTTTTTINHRGLVR